MHISTNYIPNIARFVTDFTELKYAIQHDIEDIEDLDEFLAEDPESCIHTLLGNDDCFY